MAAVTAQETGLVTAHVTWPGTAPVTAAATSPGPAPVSPPATGRGPPPVTPPVISPPPAPGTGSVSPHAPAPVPGSVTASATATAPASAAAAATAALCGPGPLDFVHLPSTQSLDPSPPAPAKPQSAPHDSPRSVLTPEPSRPRIGRCWVAPQTPHLAAGHRLTSRAPACAAGNAAPSSRRGRQQPAAAKPTGFGDGVSVFGGTPQDGR